MAHFTVSSITCKQFFLPSSLTLLGLSTLLVVAPAQALDFTTWSQVGDVSATGTQGGILTNAFDGDDTANFNQSGSNPVDINALENFLGIPLGTLGSSSQEGSAIKRSLTVQAGDTFSFDWNFLTNEPASSSNLDYAFVTIGAAIDDLAAIAAATQPSSFFLRQSGFNTYSYTFQTAGTYTIGIGVVDDSDTIVSSALQIGTPVPTPALLPGLVGLGLMALRQRKANEATK